MSYCRYWYISANNIVDMEKPIEPNNEDCCNSGCNPCIFDVYEKQLMLYKKYISGDIINISLKNGISQLAYTEFIVVKNMSICNLHNVITFKPLSLEDKIWWDPGDHFLFKYITTQISCTRAYTPFKMTKEHNKEFSFAIIVKKYDNGLVSNHLCNLNEGDLTLWRGPYGHYRYVPNKFDRLIMIAQGTGIAPFISIIDNILNNEDDMTKIVLFYCCKSENAILFREELYAFKSYWNFKYEIFLSSTISASFKYKYHEPLNTYRLSIEYLYNLKPFLFTDQFLLCGCPKFNEVYKITLEKEVPKIENIILF